MTCVYLSPLPKFFIIYLHTYDAAEPTTERVIGPVKVLTAPSDLNNWLKNVAAIVSSLWFSNTKSPAGTTEINAIFIRKSKMKEVGNISM